MDRFKFRVFSKSQQKLMIPDIFDYWTDSFGEIVKDNDNIVEQCTGLKDKNGKLIYEGDIVKVINGKYEYLYKVIWEDCAFVLKPTSINDWEDTKYLEDWLCSSETFEVIGNIHENKDLL